MRVFGLLPLGLATRSITCCTIYSLFGSVGVLTRLLLSRSLSPRCLASCHVNVFDAVSLLRVVVSNEWWCSRLPARSCWGQTVRSVLPLGSLLATGEGPGSALIPTQAFGAPTPKACTHSAHSRLAPSCVQWLQARGGW